MSLFDFVPPVATFVPALVNSVVFSVIGLVKPYIKSAIICFHNKFQIISVPVIHLYDAEKPLSLNRMPQRPVIPSA